ncbi:MAG: phosphatidylglycerophosphatase A [Candidatus Omnitrophica bacterium]|nr:phosphatidylglycerophosphatase A [Candidatus Omnitrophota bacterium]MDD5690128.1 phosphatidylglycerophosphatase A [Candidatus Omnitrophota bacterium]
MRFTALGDLLIKAISTFFFIGYLPLIPGTFGSIAGVGIFYLLAGSSRSSYFLFLFCIMVLGVLTSGRAEKLLNKKDPGCIVIDEVMGMLIALCFLPPEPKIVFLAFIIFRILDMLKPFPAGRLQNLHGAIGVMGDDLVAGAYASIVLHVILNLSRAV